MRVGEKVVFIDCNLSLSLKELSHLTQYKVYNVCLESNENACIWIVDDRGGECGYGTGTYKFEKLSDYRKKKLKKLKDEYSSI